MVNVMARTIATNELRNNLSSYLSRVGFGHERFVIERHGKPVAALVPITVLQFVEEAIDRADLKAAQEALEEALEELQEEPELQKAASEF